MSHALRRKIRIHTIYAATYLPLQTICTINLAPSSQPSMVYQACYPVMPMSQIATFLRFRMHTCPCPPPQGTISSEEAATLLGVTELKESDLVPSVYEGKQ